MSSQEVSPNVPGTRTTGSGCGGGGLQRELTAVGGGGPGAAVVVDEAGGPLGVVCEEVCVGPVGLAGFGWPPPHPATATARTTAVVETRTAKRRGWRCGPGVTSGSSLKSVT